MLSVSLFKVRRNASTGSVETFQPDSHCYYYYFNPSNILHVVASGDAILDRYVQIIYLNIFLYCRGLIQVRVLNTIVATRAPPSNQPN